MTEKTCAACHGPLPAPAGRGRPAKFCSTKCRRAAVRARKISSLAEEVGTGKRAGNSLSPAAGVDPKKAEGSKKGAKSPRRSAASTQDARGQLLKVVRRELTENDRLDTVDGQQALQLATVLSGYFATATGLAGLSQELSRVMDRALAGTASVDDPIDELAALRNAKIAEISGKRVSS